jgi:hypothetical protein
MPQPDDGQEELVGHGQVEAVPAAVAAPAIGPVQAAPAVGVEGRQEFGQQGVEGRDGQAGHRPEDRGVLTDLFAAQDHEDLTGSCQNAWVQLS